MKREKMIEIVDDLPEGQRKELARKLAETTLDFMGTEAGSKVADVAKDTKLTIPPDVADKNEVTAEELYQVPWAREWAEEMYEAVTGEPPSKEETIDLIERKIVPTLKD